MINQLIHSFEIIPDIKRTAVRKPKKCLCRYGERYCATIEIESKSNTSADHNSSPDWKWSRKGLCLSIFKFACKDNFKIGLIGINAISWQLTRLKVICTKFTVISTKIKNI